MFSGVADKFTPTNTNYIKAKIIFKSMSKQQLLNFWRKMQVKESLLWAFQEVPRELFIAKELKDKAYHDHPLPTIRKQSISQPTTIMMMLQALELHPGHHIFEIGAGAGYQAALISKIIGPEGSLITTDVIPELIQIARHNLNKLDLRNVTILEADGGNGYPQEAPYDRIVVTTACPSIPEPLIDQLKEGGIIIAPVGDLDNQTMVKGIKQQGRLSLEFLGSFRFVPLQGKWGFELNQVV